MVAFIFSLYQSAKRAHVKDYLLYSQWMTVLCFLSSHSSICSSTSRGSSSFPSTNASCSPTTTYGGWASFKETEEWGQLDSRGGVSAQEQGMCVNSACWELQSWPCWAVQLLVLKGVVKSTENTEGSWCAAISIERNLLRWFLPTVIPE